MNAENHLVVLLNPTVKQKRPEVSVRVINQVPIGYLTMMYATGDNRCGLEWTGRQRCGPIHATSRSNLNNLGLKTQTVTRTKRVYTYHLGADFSIKSNIKHEIKLRNNIIKEEPIPAFYWNYFQPHTPYEKFTLGKCALRVLGNINAGGNSIVSEALSAELFTRVFNANNIRTEMEVEYIFYNWKIADYTIRMYDKNVGVSVTRAFTYPNDDLFSIEFADKLLRKKITGLILARGNTDERDGYLTSILHIYCRSERVKNILKRAYNNLPENIKDNIIILCTITEGECDFIYKNLLKNKSSKSSKKFNV